MIRLRRAQERGHTKKGWLDSYHTFSFGNYYDSEQTGWGSLVVINEDFIAPKKGFGAHNHNDMEIVTYMLEGFLEHEDSMGNTSVIAQGQVQRMTAGSGVIHSEYNRSPDTACHLLQIWIRPEANGLTPSYAEKTVSEASKWGQWCLIASRNGRAGSLTIHQDADIYATLLEKGDALSFESLPSRKYWIQLIRGRFRVNEVMLEAGDGAAITDENTLKVKCLEEGELLLFDLA